MLPVLDVISEKLADCRHSLMAREMTDDGWDLRDDVIALQELLAMLVAHLQANESAAARR